MKEIMWFLIGLFLLYIVCKVFSKSLKTIWRLLLNGIVGGIVLIIVNFLGEFLSFNIIPINWMTALIAGLFGVPGTIFLLIINNI